MTRITKLRRHLNFKKIMFCTFFIYFSSCYCTYVSVDNKLNTHQQLKSYIKSLSKCSYLRRQSDDPRVEMVSPLHVGYV